MNLASVRRLHGVGAPRRVVNTKRATTLIHSYNLFMLFYSGWQCIVERVTRKITGDEDGSDSN